MSLPVLMNRWTNQAVRTPVLCKSELVRRYFREHGLVGTGRVIDHLRSLGLTVSETLVDRERTKMRQLPSRSAA